MKWSGSRCMTFTYIPTQRVPAIIGSGTITRIPNIASVPRPTIPTEVPAPPRVVETAPPATVGPVQRCRRPRPVGTPPNCCPLHTYYSNGACRRLARPSSIGKPTAAVTPGAADKVQRQSPGGSGAVGVQAPRCPPSRPVGTPPYCCQRGAQYIAGVGCRSSGGAVRAQVPPPQCGEGMIRRADGSCGCPKGLTGTGCKFPLVR
jgi:hypothetical protein